MAGVGATRAANLQGIGLSSPSALAGLVLWLDANSLALAGAAAPADADPVSSWRSKVKFPVTSEDVTFTAASTARPLYKTAIQNSMPGVLFDGSNDLMTGPNTWPNFFCRGERTLFVVFKPTALVATGSGITYSRPHLIGTIGQYDGISISPSGSDNIVTAWDYDDVSVRTASTGVLTPNNTALVTSWHDAGVLSISLNGATAVTTTLRDITTSGSTVQLGTSGSGAFYTGHLFEILGYNRSLTALERAMVGNYLKQKWAI